MKRLAPLLCGIVLASEAFAQAPLSRDIFANDGLAFEGGESLLLDFATLPSTYYRLDALGQPVPGIRLAQWVNLSTRSFGSGGLRFTTSFRYDLDTGVTPAEQAAFPLLMPHRWAILSAFFDVDLTKRLSLRGGRQYKADLADFLAFDGARLALELPIPMQIEVYGGVRTSLGITQGAVASSLYELDGVAQVEGTQPLVGVTLRSTGGFLSRREWSVGFRQSWRTSTQDRVLDAALPDGLYTTAQELTASGASDVGPLHLRAGLAFEVLLARLMRAHAALSLPVSDHVHVPVFEHFETALEYNRWQPTFALDSIWNWFLGHSFDELGLTAVGRRGEVRFEGRLFGRLFRSVDERGGLPLVFSPGSQLATGGRFGLVSGRFGALKDAWFQWHRGFGGTRLVLDAGWQLPLAELVSAHLRASGVYWRQDLQPLQSGFSLCVVAGVSVRLPAGASFALLVEETLNAFASPVPRVYGMLDLARWL